MVTPEQILIFSKKAQKRIKKHVFKTPVYHEKQLSTSKTNLYLKCENLQYTSSFKLRGAASKLTSLQKKGINNIITASTGNHGMAIGYILEKLGMNGSIYVPKAITQQKEKKLSLYTKNIIKHGFDSEETERKAKKISENEQIPYISPYNDTEIIAGQSTIALELLEDLKQIDNIFVTVGGGGMISGIASILKNHNPDIMIYGCQPKNSAVMYKSIKEGKIVQMESKPTLSDGSAGGIEAGSITFGLCRELTDEFVLVSESEIKEAIRKIFSNQQLIIEGAAGVAMASYLKLKDRLQGNSVVVLCGGNIEPKLWLEIVSENLL